MLAAHYAHNNAKGRWLVGTHFPKEIIITHVQRFLLQMINQTTCQLCQLCKQCNNSFHKLNVHALLLDTSSAAASGAASGAPE